MLGEREAKINKDIFCSFFCFFEALLFHAVPLLLSIFTCRGLVSSNCQWMFWGCWHPAGKTVLLSPHAESNWSFEMPIASDRSTLSKMESVKIALSKFVPRIVAPTKEAPSKLERDAAPPSMRVSSNDAPGSRALLNSTFLIFDLSNWTSIRSVVEMGSFDYRVTIRVSSHLQRRKMSCPNWFFEIAKIYTTIIEQCASLKFILLRLQDLKSNLQALLTFVLCSSLRLVSYSFW